MLKEGGGGGVRGLVVISVVYFVYLKWACVREYLDHGLCSVLHMQMIV